MTHTLRFRPEVVNDLEDGASWHDARRIGLGAEFLRECKAALDRILDRPEQATIKREFNIGFDCGDEPWAFNQGLSNDVLRRMAACGATFRITLYPHRQDSEADNVNT